MTNIRYALRDEMLPNYVFNLCKYLTMHPHLHLQRSLGGLKAFFDMQIIPDAKYQIAARCEINLNQKHIIGG